MLEGQKPYFPIKNLNVTDLVWGQNHANFLIWGAMPPVPSCRCVPGRWWFRKDDIMIMMIVMMMMMMMVMMMIGG